MTVSRLLSIMFSPEHVYLQCNVRIIFLTYKHEESFLSTEIIYITSRKRKMYILVDKCQYVCCSARTITHNNRNWWRVSDIFQNLSDGLGSSLNYHAHHRGCQPSSWKENDMESPTCKHKNKNFNKLIKIST